MILLDLRRLSTWVCLFGRGSLEWQEKKGCLLTLRLAQSAVATGWALFLHYTAGQRVASHVGKAGEWPQIPCLLALHFVQRKAVTCFICLPIRFPHKSLFEAGLLGLSLVSTSVCQQAGRVHAPNTLNRNQMELLSVTFQGSLALCSLRPRLRLRILMSESLPVFATRKRSWLGRLCSFDT